jgi:hypothetical protein
VVGLNVGEVVGLLDLGVRVGFFLVATVGVFNVGARVVGTDFVGG